MVSFAPISGAPIAARDLDYVAAAGATGTVTLGQGSQSVVATGTVTNTATVTLGQGSQSIAAVGEVTGAIIVPPATGAGGVASGRTYVISGEESKPRAQELDKYYVPIKREPFEVKLKPSRQDLKALRDRLYELGRLLARKKQDVKDRIKAEQAQAVSPELILILQTLIAEYELDLYNQNAARLLILLAEV